MSYKLADGSDSSQYKEGDLFEVVSGENSFFDIGEVVKATNDRYVENNEEYLCFARPSDDFDRQYLKWCQVKPHSKPFTKDDLKDGDVLHDANTGTAGILFCSEVLFKPKENPSKWSCMPLGDIDFNAVSKVERQGTVVFQRKPELIEKTIKATAEQWEKINEILEPRNDSN